MIRDDEQYEVVLGWDPPLGRYFVQVYDKSVHEDANPVVWEMGPRDEMVRLALPYVPSLDDLVAGEQQIAADAMGNVA